MASDTNHHYRLGVALSGGGARGFAHAGALKALEEAGCRPDVLAGVSAGAVAAVLYAAGVKPEAIPDVFSNLKFNDLCRLRLSGHSLLDMSGFKKVVSAAVAPHRMLEDLDIPTYVGVTDFDSGKACHFCEGPLIDCVAASCSIPVVFAPVKIAGVNYVDGGVLRNLPASVIRDKCDVLVGIDCSSRRLAPRSKQNLLETAIRSFMLLSRANAIHDLELCDMVISIDEISDHKVFDLKGIRKCYDSGYAAARKALEKICLIPDIKTDSEHESE